MPKYTAQVILTYEVEALDMKEAIDTVRDVSYHLVNEDTGKEVLARAVIYSIELKVNNGDT